MTGILKVNVIYKIVNAKILYMLITNVISYGLLLDHPFPEEGHNEQNLMF